MILDALLQFSAAQPLTAIGAVDSTNILDFGINQPSNPTYAQGGGARDLGIGDDPALKLFVTAQTGFASAGAGTLQVTIQGAPDNGAGAPGAFTPWYSTPVYPLASLGQGARLMDMDIPRPPQGSPVPRYLKLTYTVAGAAFTAGAVSSYIVLDRADQMYNANNNAILGGYVPGQVVNN